MAQQFSKNEIKKKTENISEWYNDIVLKAGLSDYGPVKGTMVIRPYGYAIWEKIQETFNVWIKDYGVQNAYFPMFIPMSLLTKEKEHVEGFSPELAIVTIGGGEKLTEPLAVRPTSETIMYSMYAKWIKSWRDLPMCINQWNNVVRCEKRTYMFLRTTEFLWQEGHTAHATHEECLEMAHQAHEWYRKIHEEYLAVPVILGVKSKTEQFAGAVSTFTVEALMPDGKALQSATSHDLGTNFSKVFDIKFQDKTGGLSNVWQTSWGLSTRSIGGMLLIHGDDNGVVLPPKIAPIQVVIIPIFKKDVDQTALREYCTKLRDSLGGAGIRVHFDGDDNTSPGRKFNEWEVKGVPIRLEIGLKEMEVGKVTVARRDTGEKLFDVPAENLAVSISTLLETIQNGLFAKAKKFMDDNTFTVDSWDEFKRIMTTTRGFIRAFWCGEASCEKSIKDETKATTRCLPLNAIEENGTCIRCGAPAKFRWIFGQSY